MWKMRARCFAIVCITLLTILYVALNQLLTSNLRQNYRNVTVTRRIHQTWKSHHNLPPQFQIHSKTWRSCYPTWEYKLWNDTENRDLIREHYAWFLDTYDNYPRNINRADAVRYFILHRYGGIYADLDTDCLRPFEDLLANYSAVFGAMEGEKWEISYDGMFVQNSFMYSRPGLTFWMEIGREMKCQKNEQYTEWATGPVLLMKVMKQTKRENSRLWKVYPSDYFNPYSWINNSHPLPSTCKHANTMTPQEYDECKKYFVDRNLSYVVQYHAHTWEKVN